MQVRNCVLAALAIKAKYHLLNTYLAFGEISGKMLI